MIVHHASGAFQTFYFVFVFYQKYEAGGAETHVTLAGGEVFVGLVFGAYFNFSVSVHRDVSTVESLV